MVNPHFEPNEEQEKILEILKDGRDSGEPWGISNPLYLQEKTEIEKQNLNYHLRRLVDSGWIKKPVDGLYVFVEDPRE